MQILLSKYNYFQIIINFLFCFLPLSFIAGNLIINLNVILIILISLIYFGKSIIDINLLFFEKILILFFFVSLTSGIINNINFFGFNSADSNSENFFKSFAFLRYLIFYLILRKLIDDDIINYKIFFLTASICVIFVCLDLMIQLVSGKDLFGFPKTSYKLSGPFGDEMIAGSYLQRFSIFLFFLIPNYLKNMNRNILILILSLFFILIFSSMLIAGNRMPILLFLFVFVTFFFLEKKLRNFSILFTIFSILIFLIIHSFSPQIQDYTKYFFKIISEIFVFLHEIIVQGADPNITNTYIKEFYSGYVSWLENPIVGGGINSFYLNCVKNFEFCASHPHNYYLEILSEVGLIGFAVIIVVFYGILSLSVKNKNELSMNFIKNLNFPFLLLFFAEVFPIKSSGSFFTTGNATFIFLVMAILVSLSKRSKYN